MKTLDERIADAENTLGQAKTSGDSEAEAKADARLEALREAKEFHTKELDRLGKKLRSEGGEATEKKIAEDFGVTIEEANQIIADHQAAQDAIETAADTERKAREAVEKERDELKQREADALTLADNRLIQAELKGSLRDSGIQAEYLPLALRLADTSTVEITDGEVQGISDVVEAVKKASPVWFGTSHERLPITPGGSGSRGGVAEEISKRRYDKLPAHLKSGR